MKLPKDICGRVIHDGDRLLCVEPDWARMLPIEGKIYCAAIHPDWGTCLLVSRQAFRADRFLNIEKFLNGEL